MLTGIFCFLRCNVGATTLGVGHLSDREGEIGVGEGLVVEREVPPFCIERLKAVHIEESQVEGAATRVAAALADVLKREEHLLPFRYCCNR